MLDGLLLLLLFQFLGEALVSVTGIPVPGPVVGMILLLLALLSRQPVLQRVAPAANLLIGNLTLLFFPIGVGIILEWDRYSDNGLALLVSVVGGTLVTMSLVIVLLKRLLPEAP
ncbi:MAG: CidA/LrgA family protein [Alcanivoracaceae bacterium]|jgi:holin-like protein|nr:CidA/LrgA family protein [Alcanivoracaceae bacterium]